MELILDTANIEDIKDLYTYLCIDGVTTNPSIASKEGKNFATLIKEIDEVIGQIQNLREEPSGQGIKEKRISQRIQRDSWSALKYCLRFAQKLEQVNLQRKQSTSDWAKLLAQFRGKDLIGGMAEGSGRGRMVTGRRGGRLF